MVDKTYYLPFGEYRRGDSSILTESGFTGHLHNDSLGLIYMNARFYSPSSGRFITADTIIPDPQNPQSYNRYSYTYNNPLRFTDPSGHISCEELGTEECHDDGTFVDAPPTFSDLADANLTSPESLPPGGNGVDITLWLYRQMVINATGSDAAEIKYLWETDFVGAGFSLGFSFDEMDYRALALSRFTELVDYGQPWDFKKLFKDEKIKYVTLAGHQFRMDIVANIHYGYVGKAAGLPSLLLYAAAGAAQQIGGDADKGQWYTFFDEPVDRNAISLGISLYENNSALSYEAFVYAINLYVDLGAFDEYMLSSNEQ